MSDYVEVSLDKMSGGAAIERFNDALKDVLENISDPNMNPDTVREIVLSVKFKQDKNDASKVAYAIEVRKKLAMPVAVGAIMYIGKENGQIKAIGFGAIRQPKIPLKIICRRGKLWQMT